VLLEIAQMVPILRANRCFHPGGGGHANGHKLQVEMGNLDISHFLPKLKLKVLNFYVSV
jgi:hypothetical protein